MSTAELTILSFPKLPELPFIIQTILRMRPGSFIHDAGPITTLHGLGASAGHRQEADVVGAQRAQEGALQELCRAGGEVKGLQPEKLIAKRIEDELMDDRPGIVFTLPRQDDTGPAF